MSISAKHLPQVSIVTISFNQARFLEQAILSVLEQDYPDIEYIIVDPGSTDGSREIIEKYRHKIDQIIFEPDDGPVWGLNKGFQRAKGDIFGYLNSDDILMPTAVSQIVHAFQRSSDTSVMSGHGAIIDADSKLLKPVYSHRFNLKAYAYGVCILVQQATFFRKDPFFKVGGFNPINRVSWDGELWVDMALNGVKFGRVHSNLASFRVYASSITGSGKFQVETQKQHARICQKINIDPKSKFKRTLCWILNRLSDPIATTMRILDEFKHELPSRI